MQNAEIREQTASEELTIEEEYAMQRSWYEDNDSWSFSRLPTHLCRF
jgi:hypothetical protein